MQQQNSNNPIRIEGYTPDEIIQLSDAQVESLVLCDRPLVFRVGTAEVLGQFRASSTTLALELAQIDGGGEGILATLWTLAERYAQKRQLGQVAWIVHALHCAQPNVKLRRVLQRRGFTIQYMPEIGNVYYFVHTIQRDVSP